jgi:hypothetical protein
MNELAEIKGRGVVLGMGLLAGVGYVTVMLCFGHLGDAAVHG